MPSDDLLTVHKSICGQVSNREPGLQKFAGNHDVIIFVSGHESSNGKMLYSVCKDENPDSYMISSPSELRREWFAGKHNTGVCGATSTPKWLIEEVATAIKLISEEH
jgi:4-hydroxy-3-methylbut-2-enyl diphosphate reductase